jgi:hypothetical protein
LRFLPRFLPRLLPPAGDDARPRPRDSDDDAADEEEGVKDETAGFGLEVEWSQSAQQTLKAVTRLAGLGLSIHVMRSLAA